MDAKEKLKQYQKEYHKRWYQQNKHLYKSKRKDSTSSTYQRKKLYTVWNNTTDEVVIVDGNINECAKAMGVSVNSFYSIVTKSRKGIQKKWTIEKRLILSEERK